MLLDKILLRLATERKLSEHDKADLHIIFGSLSSAIQAAAVAGNTELSREVRRVALSKYPRTVDDLKATRLRCTAPARAAFDEFFQSAGFVLEWE